MRYVDILFSKTIWQSLLFLDINNSSPIGVFIKACLYSISSPSFQCRAGELTRYPPRMINVDPKIARNGKASSKKTQPTNVAIIGG